MNASRFKFPNAAVRLQSGDVLIAGGAALREIFRPKERAFITVNAGLEAACYFASATLLNDGNVLVVGGYSEGKGGYRPRPVHGSIGRDVILRTFLIEIVVTPMDAEPGNRAHQ
jgi:hypothetical protein